MLAVETGCVILHSAGTNTGRFDIAAGATLRPSNNFRSFAPVENADAIFGAGTLELFAGSSDFNGTRIYDISAPTVLNGGTLGRSSAATTRSSSPRMPHTPRWSIRRAMASRGWTSARPAS